MFRSRFIPLLMVCLATALTAPWTLWVFKIAYDRHVIDNAQMVARRVELRVGSQASAVTSAQQARVALATEVVSNVTVQRALFCDLDGKPDYIVGWSRDNPEGMPPWNSAEIHARALGGVTRTQTPDRICITVPWLREQRPMGFTYLEFSRAALNNDFWAKEGPLLTRVIGLNIAAVAFLSALAIVAYRAWQRVEHVQERAELAREAQVAERGLTAAVLAHEIRNPLAALRFQLHALRSHADEQQRVTRTADTIDAELLRIQQLVSDYLDHEQARAMRMQTVDLPQEAHKLKTLMDELLAQSGTTLSVLADPPAVAATCDPHALRQVLMNLVINAHEAIQRGPSHGNAITLRVGAQDGFATIDVTDTGPGIPAEMHQRLFKPFATTRRDGHGIGLALVKRFVDNFGGSVAVESAPGQGTTFHLRLPLAQTSAP